MKFRTGLVVGKFSPLHRGHQHLIEHAVSRCERVILLSYAKPGYSRCDTSTRQRWLKTLYPDATSLVVDDAWLAGRRAEGLDNRFTSVPHDDEPEDIHRRFTAWLCHGVLGQSCDVVFTSEDYGDGFAKVLTEEFAATQPVSHICVDRARQAVPISATAIRRDPALHAQYLSPTVRASFVPRILFLGAESTGKTMLARALSERLGQPLVEEYGRDLWIERGGALGYPDMLHIGRAQVDREEQAALAAERFILCDTSPLTTLLYSQAMFRAAEPELEALSHREYDQVYLCLPEFVLVQDGTRQDEAFRARQHDWYLEVLTRRSIGFETVSGDLATRIARVEAHLCDLPIQTCHPAVANRALNQL